jgi:hypothetical protein
MDEMFVQLKQMDGGMDEMSVRLDDGTDPGEVLPLLLPQKQTHKKKGSFVRP